MLPSWDDADLPRPLRATLHSFRDRFLRLDRGHVRSANDKTADSRATFFASFLEREGYDTVRLAELSDEEWIPPLCAYVWLLAQGETIKGSGQVIAEKTIMGYLNAARDWIRVHFRCSPPTHSQKGTKLVLMPLFAEIIRHRRAWRRPQQKKEPISGEMFRWMAKEYSQQIREHDANRLALVCAVIDWLVLVLFTGSRLAEYGQSKLPKGLQFAIIPKIIEAGEWGGMPIAFVESDFTFYDAQHQKLSIADAISIGAQFVHIRFRYDKSKENFSIRKFQRQSKNFLCPVRASRAIIARARRLRVPLSEPLGVFRINSNGDYAFLKGADVVGFLHRACREAHPDSTHYLRQHIKRLVSHSTRVTAAVALSNVGVAVDDIAFRLRWHPESVKFYLRDCFRTIGSLTEQAVNGAMLL